MSNRKAYMEILGVNEEMDYVDAKRIANRAIRNAHPDIGGKAEDFIRLKEAWDNCNKEEFFGKKIPKIRHKNLFEIIIE